MLDYEALWRHITERFALGPDSLHGPAHWRRVERNGLELAGATAGADTEVVRLFAVFHDSRRLNESTDPDHGRRGADHAGELRGRLFELDDARFERLAYACTWHEWGRVSDDPTVGACWDADRLDLTRVGARPVARLMSTAEGKRRARG